MTNIKSRASTRRSLAAAWMALACLAGAVLPAHAQSVPQVLPTVQLSAGMHLIRAMVARSPDERGIGLMFRAQMGANEGMLFIFEEPAQQCFWMKNTLLPLSAAFVADDGTVVNIEDMKPMSTDSHCSTAPVRYVLEMHQGWFAKRGFKAGSRLAGPPFR
jgi:uncharacterized membrane protein (UPF0127 family)